jgi:hypothetical protein
MKKIFAAIFIACAGWIAWPFYALYDLAAGLEQGDPVVLERRIEWSGVRQGLRDDINAMFIAMIATDPLTSKPDGGSALGTGLSAIFGPAIINQMIDAYVSPQTLPNLIRRGRFTELNVTEKPSQENISFSKFNWSRITYAFFSGGPSTFLVETNVDLDSTERPLILLFKWTGDWKLTRIFLPSDAIARVAFDRAKAANTIQAWDAFLGYFRDGPLVKQAREERQKQVDLAIQKQNSRANRIDESTLSPGYEQAVLYEEDPKNPQGNKLFGMARWYTEKVLRAPGSELLDLAATADVTIPDRTMNMKWSLRLNVDKTLPASHTIDIRFKFGSAFLSDNIANAPGVLMKDVESGRGIPLAGLAVKVSSDYFLIGLSAVTADSARNISLLKDRSWIDIPIVYGNGRRAILAINKGNSGNKALTEAFSSWDNTRVGTQPPNNIRP